LPQVFTVERDHAEIDEGIGVLRLQLECLFVRGFGRRGLRQIVMRDAQVVGRFREIRLDLEGGVILVNRLAKESLAPCEIGGRFAFFPQAGTQVMVHTGALRRGPKRGAEQAFVASPVPRSRKRLCAAHYQ